VDENAPEPRRMTKRGQTRARAAGLGTWEAGMVRLVVQHEMSEEQRNKDHRASVQPAWLRCVERVKFLIRCVLWSP
jgi:hypothetical protein